MLFFCLLFFFIRCFSCSRASRSGLLYFFYFYFFFLLFLLSRFVISFLLSVSILVSFWFCFFSHSCFFLSLNSFILVLFLVSFLFLSIIVSRAMLLYFSVTFLFLLLLFFVIFQLVPFFFFSFYFLFCLFFFLASYIYLYNILTFLYSSKDSICSLLIGSIQAAALDVCTRSDAVPDACRFMSMDFSFYALSCSSMDSNAF